MFSVTSLFSSLMSLHDSSVWSLSRLDNLLFLWDIYYFSLQVKIQGQNEEMLLAACEQFLGKNDDEITQVRDAFTKKKLQI